MLLIVIGAVVQNSEKGESSICISASDLATEYGFGRAAADAKYKGKSLVITGVVAHQNDRVVDLETERGWWYVRCFGANFTALRDRQQVTLKCTGDGTFYPLTVSSCSLVPPQTPCVAERKPAIPTSGPNVVHVTLSPLLTGDTLTISGTTDVKDGALFGYEVEHDDNKSQRGSPFFRDGDMTIRSGRYSATVDLKGWPKGRITVWVAFFTFLKEQPQWVRTQYGEGGKELEGPNVQLGLEGMKTLEIQTAIVRP